MTAQEASDGSPPRVRGKPCRLTSCRLHVRITPACAGKTLFAEARHSRRADHPRVCGENIFPRMIRRSGGGSPPRVRGKLVWYGLTWSLERITPACAGKTATFISSVFS